MPTACCSELNFLRESGRKLLEAARPQPKDDRIRALGRVEKLVSGRLLARLLACELVAKTGDLCGHSKAPYAADPNSWMLSKLDGVARSDPSAYNAVSKRPGLRTKRA